MKNIFKLMRRYLRTRDLLEALRYGKINSITCFDKKYTRLNRADFAAEILTPLDDKIYEFLGNDLNNFDEMYFLAKQTITSKWFD